jgi:poly(3-hydroxybutyrate) depolymerase
MENIGMGPSRDTHHELDRLLRLDGYGWYSLLFAHQQMLLNHVFADAMVDSAKVGVTGVSAGGLLALTAIAMDPRVTAASVQGIFGSMRVSFIRDRNRHCPCGAIPGLLPDFDLPELALLATPRPLHISNATQDGFGPEEAKRQIERITPHYRRAGGKEPLFSSPPGRHEYAFDPALEFFEDSLGKP